jgi:hypothetical protein
MGESGSKQGGQTSPGAGESWQDVGRQFEALGASLAAAIRASVDNEATRQHVRGMQDGLEAMVKDVDRAISDLGTSPEGQRARAEAHRAAESLRAASEQTVQEVRPQLLAALKQVNAELARIVARIEATEPPPGDDKP